MTSATFTGTPGREQWTAHRRQAVRATGIFLLFLFGLLVLAALLVRWLANRLGEIAALSEIQLSSRTGIRPFGLLIARVLADDFFSGAAPTTRPTTGANL